MSKNYLLIVLGLYLGWTQNSSAAQTAEAWLIRQSKIGVNSTLHIHYDGQDYFFNQKKIDSQLAPTYIKSMQTLFVLKHEKSKSCFAGTYIHRVKKANKDSKMTGCLESLHAAQLFRSASNIENLMRLNPIK